MKVSFTVNALPQSQGSIKSFLIPAAGTKFGCKAILTSDNNKLKAYRREVALRAAEARRTSGSTMAEKHVPVAMTVDFTFLKPPSVTKKRQEMTVRPDIDKCLRSVLDACTGILWLDDAQVVAIATRKRYGSAEGVSISAWTLNEQAAMPTQLFPELELPTAPEPW